MVGTNFMLKAFIRNVLDWKSFATTYLANPDLPPPKEYPCLVMSCAVPEQRATFAFVYPSELKEMLGL